VLTSRGGGRGRRAPILTTDTVAKEAAVRFSVSRRQVTVAGMAKGSGHDRPPHGHDACGDRHRRGRRVPDSAGRRCARRWRRASTASRWTATPAPTTWCSWFCHGRCRAPHSQPDAQAFGTFRQALRQVCLALAKMIARDGEGATKLAEVADPGRTVGARGAPRSGNGGDVAAGQDHALRRGHQLGAYHGSPGAVRAPLHPERVDLSVDELPVVRNGLSLVPARRRRRPQAAAPQFALTASLHAGRAEARMWTTDLSEAYVRINAGYRS